MSNQGYKNQRFSEEQTLILIQKYGRNYFSLSASKEERQNTLQEITKLKEFPKYTREEIKAKLDSLLTYYKKGHQNWKYHEEMHKMMKEIANNSSAATAATNAPVFAAESSKEEITTNIKKRGRPFKNPQEQDAKKQKIHFPDSESASSQISPVFLNSLQLMKNDNVNNKDPVVLAKPIETIPIPRMVFKREKTPPMMTIKSTTNATTSSGPILNPMSQRMFPIADTSSTFPNVRIRTADNYRRLLVPRSEYNEIKQAVAKISDCMADVKQSVGSLPQGLYQIASKLDEILKQQVANGEKMNAIMMTLNTIAPSNEKKL